MHTGPGSDNCFWKGIAILPIIFASFILAQRFRKDNGPDQKPERRPYSSNMLMLIAAWAGFGLAENFMLMLVAWVVLLHSFYRWQEMSGVRGRFLVIRDDFADV